VDALPRDVLLKKAYVSRALVCDAAGRVYGSGAQASIFRYDPANGALDRLEGGLPIGMGTENGLIAEPSLSAAVLASDGMVYGGTVQDGYLFSFDPATATVRNLGKPTRQGHIRALAEWAGDIYGLVGEDGGKCHLFRYGLSSGSLEDLGVLQGNGRRGFSVNECAALATCGDRLVIGQSERISTLHSFTRLVYEPYQSP
jgi:tricorn protease-like protein